MMLSPYLKTKEVFLSRIRELSREYGYNQFFIAFSEAIDGNSDNWNSDGNCVSDGMAEYVEICLEIMNKRLKERE